MQPTYVIEYLWVIYRNYTYSVSTHVFTHRYLTTYVSITDMGSHMARFLV